MKVDIRLSREVTGRSAIYARAARFLSELAIFINREILLSDTSIPSLYQSGVIYRNEEIGKPDELVDIIEIRKRGWGDCLHLTSWRIAELRNQGENATPHYSWIIKGKLRVFHVQVRRSNGKLEDPSRKLGM